MAVVVKASKIAGAGGGLFAARSFAVGDWVVAYGGEKHVFEGLRHLERARACAAALQAANGHSVFLGHGDGCCVVVDGCKGGRKTPAGYMINSNPAAANAEYVVKGRDVWAIATAGIAAGDEIYVDYGFGHAFGHGIDDTGGASREVVEEIKAHFRGAVTTPPVGGTANVLQPRRKAFVSFV